MSYLLFFSFFFKSGFSLQRLKESKLAGCYRCIPCAVRLGAGLENLSQQICAGIKQSDSFEKKNPSQEKKKKERRRTRRKRNDA